jgi:thymidylate synthase
MRHHLDHEQAYINTLLDIEQHGEEIESVKDESSITFGKTSKEVLGYSFKILNPRNRIIYNRARKFNIFAVLGHFLWIMRGANDLMSIEYYNPKAAGLSDNNTTHRAAYGDRMMNCNAILVDTFKRESSSINQIETAIERLEKDPLSRRAFISIYNPALDSDCFETRDFPCTIGYHFLIRRGVLDMVCFMRSQNALFVMPYDIFINTMLQEYIANRLGVDVGSYIHTGSSFHIFDKEQKLADAILEIGCSEKSIMRMYLPMDPFGFTKTGCKGGFENILNIEKEIRLVATEEKELSELPPYFDRTNDFTKSVTTLLQLHALNFIRTRKGKEDYKDGYEIVLYNRLPQWAKCAVDIIGDKQ